MAKKQKLLIQNPASFFMTAPHLSADMPGVAPVQNPPTQTSSVGKKHGVQLLIDVDLYDRARQHATKSRRTFTKLVFDLITETLDAEDTHMPFAPLHPATRFMSIPGDKRFVAQRREDIDRKRVHLNMDTELYERVKKYAAARELSVNKLINDLLYKVCP